MNKHLIHHQGNRFYCYPIDKETLQIKIRTGLDIQKVVLHYGDPNDYTATIITKKIESFKPQHLIQHHKFVKFNVAPSRLEWGWNKKHNLMKLENKSSHYHYFKIDIKPKNYRCKYYFELITESETVYFGENGFYKDDTQLNIWSTFYYPYIHENEIHKAPKWVNQSVWCQIFVERFSNGDLSNDPENTQSWNDPIITSHSFYGGDLRGIINNLEHLKEQGFNGIYLTPIFQSPSNHKYDTTDYFEIDSHFGSKEDLKEMIDKAHQLGIKVMLDAVFNHSGDTWIYFLDVVKNREHSKYADWFHIKTFEPLTYHTFANTKKMPKLNTYNKELQEYLLSILTYYLEEFNIDGWRFDVANELDHDFIRLVNRTLKNKYPDAYLLGELWHDKSDWVTYDQFDAQMDYRIANLFVDYANQVRSAQEIVDALCEYHYHTPDPIQLSSFHMLDSHDTPRLMTKVYEDEKRAFLSIALSSILSGSVCYFYGTDYLLAGAMDPLCRIPYPIVPTKEQLDRATQFKSLIQNRLNHLDQLQTTPTYTIQNECLVIQFESFTLITNNTDETKQIKHNKTNTLDPQSYEFI